MNKLVGLFGGTFDPVHLGHTRVAENLLKALPFSEIQFIPCNLPPHRTTPIASSADRLAMLKLATEKESRFSVNDIEIKRSGISYTIDTLKTLRSQFPSTTFALILSTDTLGTFNTWHNWQKILDYCHLIIVNRPNYALPQTPWVQEFLSQHQIQDPTVLTQLPAGKIFFTSLTETPISATDLRTYLSEKNYSNASSYLSPFVLNYIQTRSLYR